MTKLTRAASGALAALACVALTVDVSAQRGRGAAPGPQGRTGGPAAPPAAVSIADDPLSGPIVTNAPFSADAVTTVTQVLSDGTRIEQTTTAKFYRDSAGRVRSEQTVLGLGALDPNSQPRTTITITTDPNTRATYTLDPATKTARQGGGVLRFYSALTLSANAITAATPAGTAYAVTINPETNRERERRAVTVQEGLAAVRILPGAASVTADGNAVRQPDETLGTRQMEGINAVGKRTKSVIATGKIGNDRPIEITDERWESQDLRLLVRSHHRDPRTGDVEYRLTNIVRVEPPADLFTIPSDYTVVGDTLNGTPGLRLGGPAPAAAPAAGAGGGGGGRGGRQGGN